MDSLKILIEEAHYLLCRADSSIPKRRPFVADLPEDEQDAAYIGFMVEDTIADVLEDLRRLLHLLDPDSQSQGFNPRDFFERSRWHNLAEGYTAA